MFYIHEVLTDRKHGVATVWLLATLGSKSGVRKLNRRNIQGVNVPKACETIVNPTAPMALRLQGSLLYGVSRAYNKQCEYLYADAETIHRIIKQELHGFQQLDIDLDAGKAKAAAENLTLQDDPTFIPDLIFPAFDLDLSELPGFELQLPGDSQQRSNFSPDTSQGSQPLRGLDLRSLTESSVIGGFRLPGAGDADQLTLAFGDDEGFDPNIDFGFDADGNMIDLSEHPTRATRETPRPVILGSDVSPQHTGQESARQALLEDHDRMDLDDVPPLQDDDGSDSQPAPTTPEDSTESFGVPETAIIGLRLQPRVARVIPMDSDTTLHNRTIKDWNRSYTEHMLEARGRRLGQKVKSQAKKNAEYWISQMGLGGAGMSPTTGPFGPLRMFHGEDLINTIVPLPTASTRTRKRGREHLDSDDDSEGGRRSRDEVEAGLGWAGDNEVIQGPDDEVEVAREAQPELDDISTVMPWNITASVRGSSAHRLSSIGRIASSIKGLTSFGTGVDVRHRDTESPLVGRGTSLSNQPIQLGDTGISSDFAGPGDLEFLGAEGELSEDEEERAQTQTESQMQRAALDRESDNFLSFIQDGIEAKQDEEEDAASVTFAELLPPDTTSKMVAAQGLFHVLALGTKNLIKARQEQSFDGIHIGLLAV